MKIDKIIWYNFILVHSGLIIDTHTLYNPQSSPPVFSLIKTASSLNIIDPT